MLNEVGGLTLSSDDVAALTDSTDGWAAGLRLAALFLHGGADASSLLSRLCGANDVIGEFLAENVLETLEPEIADFMLATSIAERICGELASVLSEHPRGLAMLEEVARRGLFLQRIDDDPGWFRYHQLFAEFLRHRLARDDPERSQRLHRTAAAWFAEHGYLNEAVNHALAADDATLAVDLFERDYPRLLEASKMTTLLEIAKKLPPPLVAARARLQLAIAWANILLQRRAPADAALNRFEAALGSAEPRISRERISESRPMCCAGWQTYSPTVLIVSTPLSSRRSQDLIPSILGYRGLPGSSQRSLPFTVSSLTTREGCCGGRRRTRT